MVARMKPGFSLEVENAVNTNIDRRRLLQVLGLGPVAAAAAAPVPAAPARVAVRVLFTRVNGELHYDAAARFDTLTIGDSVTLRRDPDNAHDRRAIEVFDAHDYKLGYVARIDNSAVARMMDAGERFDAQVARLTPPLDIRIGVDWLRG